MIKRSEIFSFLIFCLQRDRVQSRLEVLIDDDIQREIFYVNVNLKVIKNHGIYLMNLDSLNLNDFSNHNYYVKKHWSI